MTRSKNSKKSTLTPAEREARAARILAASVAQMERSMAQSPSSETPAGRGSYASAEREDLGNYRAY